MKKTTLSLMMFLSVCIALMIIECKRQDEIKKAKQQATFESGGIVNTNPITDTSGEYVMQKDSIEKLGSLLILHHNDGTTYVQRINDNTDTINGNETDTSQDNFSAR